MSDVSVFEWTCEALEQATTLERLEARGTVRIALKAAGLTANNVTVGQMKIVLDRVLPAELTARGIADAVSTCGRMKTRLAAQNMGAASAGDSPESVFARLGGN